MAARKNSGCPKLSGLLYPDSVFWFGTIGWYFPGIFPTDYRRKTWSGRFGIVHLAGTPFFPQMEASAPFLMDQAPLLREK
jgi:hypothetical protein